MSRFLRGASLALAALVVLAAVAAVFVVRSRRSQADVAHAIAPGIVQVHNFLSDIYGTRVGAGVILFDTGLDPAGHAIDELLRALSANRSDVSDVFLTHAHADHAAGAGLFPNARIYIGASDGDVLAQRVAARPIVPRLFGLMLAPPPAQATNLLDGRSDVTIAAGRSVLALPFPGHTPGSFLYLFDGVLFTGDSIQMEGDALTRANPNHSVDPAGNARSIARLPDAVKDLRLDIVCTGHMGCSRGADARQLVAALARQ